MEHYVIMAPDTITYKIWQKNWHQAAPGIPRAVCLVWVGCSASWRTRKVLGVLGILGRTPSRSSRTPRSISQLEGSRAMSRQPIQRALANPRGAVAFEVLILSFLKLPQPNISQHAWQAPPTSPDPRWSNQTNFTIVLMPQQWHGSFFLHVILASPQHRYKRNTDMLFSLPESSECSQVAWAAFHPGS